MSNLDQFYTLPNIAEKCMNILLSKIDIAKFDIHLEPSAGNGSFYRLMDSNKREGLDIEPKCEGVVQEDFFNYKAKRNLRYLVIGNPPFGRISSMAIKFFNHAATFAQCIAFIVPRTFKRISVQNRINHSFHLIHSEDLPMSPCCFSPSMSAKCCFQIWIKRDTLRKTIQLSRTHPHFSFLPYGENDENKQPTPPPNADFAMKAYGSNCGAVCDRDLNKLRPKSWHWIKAHIDATVLKNRFNTLDYSISKDTVRQDSIGRKEVIELYAQKYGVN